MTIKYAMLETIKKSPTDAAGSTATDGNTGTSRPARNNNLGVSAGGGIASANQLNTMKNLSLIPIENWLFIGLLLFLFWIPIPFGSNRPWSWSLLELWAFLLFGLWLSSGLAQRHWPRLRSYLPLVLPLIAVFCLLQLWLGTQLLFDTSQDPTQTIINLIKGFAYCCVLILILALTNTRKRLQILLCAIVIIGSRGGIRYFNATLGS